MLSPKAKYLRDNTKITIKYLEKAIGEPTTENLENALFMMKLFKEFFQKVIGAKYILDFPCKQIICLNIDGKEQSVESVELSEEATQACLNLLENLTEENFGKIVTYICKYMQGYIKGINAHKHND